MSCAAAAGSRAPWRSTSHSEPRAQYSVGQGRGQRRLLVRRRLAGAGQHFLDCRAVHACGVHWLVNICTCMRMQCMWAVLSGQPAGRAGRGRGGEAERTCHEARRPRAKPHELHDGGVAHADHDPSFLLKLPQCFGSQLQLSLAETICRQAHGNGWARNFDAAWLGTRACMRRCQGAAGLASRALGASCASPPQNPGRPAGPWPGYSMFGTPVVSLRSPHIPALAQLLTVEQPTEMSSPPMAAFACQAIYMPPRSMQSDNARQLHADAKQAPMPSSVHRYAKRI